MPFVFTTVLLRPLAWSDLRTPTARRTFDDGHDAPQFLSQLPLASQVRSDRIQVSYA